MEATQNQSFILTPGVLFRLRAPHLRLFSRSSFAGRLVLPAHIRLMPGACVLGSTPPSPDERNWLPGELWVNASDKAGVILEGVVPTTVWLTMRPEEGRLTRAQSAQPEVRRPSHIIEMV